MLESECLHAHEQLLVTIRRDHIQAARETAHKIYNSDVQPPSTIGLVRPPVAHEHPVALRSFDENARTEPVFLLELVSSLGMLCRLPAALNFSLAQAEGSLNVSSTTALLRANVYLIHQALDAWATAVDYQRDVDDKSRALLNHDVINMPTLMSAAVQKAAMTVTSGQRKKDDKEELKVLSMYAAAVDLIDISRELALSFVETSLLIEVYKEHLELLGLDECHSFLRFLPFESAEPSRLKVSTPIQPIMWRLTVIAGCGC